MLDRVYRRDKDGKFASTGGSGVKDLPRSDKAPTITEAAEGTNPHFGTTATTASPYEPGGSPTYRDAGRAGKLWDPTMGPPPSGAYEENCTDCVMAFEMRMRGYQVQASPGRVLDKYGYSSGRTVRQTDEQLASQWRLPGGKPHGRSFASQKWRSFDEVDKEVKGWPEGGRGFIHVGKHVFSVVKSGGKARYVESQFDASRDVTREYRKKYHSEDIAGSGHREAKLVRLDDLEPTDAILDSVVAS